MLSIDPALSLASYRMECTKADGVSINRLRGQIEVAEISET